jgi:hypothetical protein
MKRILQSPLTKHLTAMLLVGAAMVNAAEEKEEPLQSFTGSRTRVVWVQDLGRGDDAQAEGTKLRLMGMDTADGGKERPVLEKLSNYYRPLITPSGKQVVFTNQIERKVYVVNWDGSGLTEIAPGIGEAVWRDPARGIEWVYVRNGAAKRGRMPDGAIVDRFQIRQPLIEEPVWRHKTKPLEDFQLSADGTKAAGSSRRAHV